MAILKTANPPRCHLEVPLIAEALQPILIKHFESLSTSQWCMLAVQTYDSCVTASLADLVADIVQTLAAIVLRRMNPEKGWNKKALDTALKDLNKLQGDFFSTEFANALRVHIENCERAVELTELVKNEVSQKVQAIASNTTDCSVWPIKAAVFVSSSISSTESLHQMVQCVGQCLSTLNLQGFCYWQRDKIFSPETGKNNARLHPKSKMSATEVIEAVTDILSKWSSTQRTADDPDVSSDESGSVDVQPCFCQPHIKSKRNHKEIKRRSRTIRHLGKHRDDLVDIKMILAAQDAALDIVSDIWNNLPPDESLTLSPGSRENSPCFYALSIFERVARFFDSKAKPFGNVSHASQVLDNNIFPTFVQKEFEKLMIHLKIALKEENSLFLVSLKRDQRATLQKSKESQFYNIIVSGSLPSSQTTRSSNSQHDWMSRMTVKSRHSTSVWQASVSYETIKKLQSIKSREDEIEFSKDLVEKIYDHLMPEDTYAIPCVPKGKRLSDHVLSDLMTTLDNTDTYFAPDVVYAMTEDAVARFMQQVQLWMKNRSSEKAHQSEAMAGAVAEIEQLVKSLAIDVRDFTSTSSDFPSSLEMTSAESGSSAPTERNGQDDEKCCPEEVVNCIITSFCEKLITKLLKTTKTSRDKNNTDYIIKRLSYMVQEGMSFSNSAIQKLEKNLTKVTTAVMKNLHMEFDADHKLLDAVISHDTSFDDSVIKCLEIQLCCLQNTTRPTIVQWFSALGKAIIKPFWRRNSVRSG